MNAQAAALQQAGIESLKAGRLDEAIATLQQSAEVDPECYETWTYLGAAYARKGDHDASWHAFGRAVQIAPGSPKARFNLGVAHQMAGEAEEARVCYQAALKLDPNYAQARAALDKLPPESEVLAPPHRLTPQEMARLATPGGQFHMMGAQATDVNPAQGVREQSPHDPD